MGVYDRFSFHHLDSLPVLSKTHLIFFFKGLVVLHTKLETVDKNDLVSFTLVCHSLFQILWERSQDNWKPARKNKRERRCSLHKKAHSTHGCFKDLWVRTMSAALLFEPHLLWEVQSFERRQEDCVAPSSGSGGCTLLVESNSHLNGLSSRTRRWV